MIKYQGKYKSLYDVRSPEGEPDYTRPFIKMSFAHGHVGCSDWYDIISRKLEVCTNKSVTGGKKLTASFTFNFDTQEEVENFFNYCNTDFVKACNGNVKTNIVGQDMQFLLCQLILTLERRNVVRVFWD